MDERMKELQSTFIKRKLDSIADVRKLALNKDFTSLQTIGHQLKGSGGAYGFKEITEIGETLENQALSENISGALLSIDELEKILCSINARIN